MGRMMPRSPKSSVACQEVWIHSAPISSEGGSGVLSTPDQGAVATRSANDPSGGRPRGRLQRRQHAGRTLGRLPESFASTVDHVMVCDDASTDDTYEVGLAVQESSPLPITVVRHEHNLGYGGNQKAGYAWAIEHGLDIVVLLHGDGQYAPEVIERLVEPLARGEADAVFGSRMMVKGQARAGGMPVYKYVGNRILTTFQNRVTGARPDRVAQRLPRLPGRRARRPAARRATPTGSTSTPRSSWACSPPRSGSSRYRSRPTTATRSATSTAWRTPATSTTDVVRHWAREHGFGGGVSSHRDRDLRAQADELRLARRAAALAGAAPGRQGARRRLLRRPLRRHWRAARATTSPASTGQKHDGVARARRLLHRGRPQRAAADVPARARTTSWSRVTSSSTSSNRTRCSASSLERLKPGGEILVSVPELRPLVPPRPHGPGQVRLRPARPARPWPRALLHPRLASRR